MNGLMFNLRQQLKEKYKPIVPNFRAGDTVKVYTVVNSKGKEIQKTFEGFCVRKTRSTFSVRKNNGDDAVELHYSYLTPTKVDVVSYGKVRRSRIYYMRDLRGKKARIKRDYSRNS